MSAAERQQPAPGRSDAGGTGVPQDGRVTGFVPSCFPPLASLRPGEVMGTWPRCGECEDCEREAKYLHLIRPATPMETATIAPFRRTPFVIDADHLAHQREWSTATFGPGDRLKGVLDHIRKELVEVEADPTDVSEWADVLILAFDGAWRAGHEPQAILDAIAAKQARNEARNWPDWRTADPEKAIEHVRPQLCQSMVDMGERHGIVKCLAPMPCAVTRHQEEAAEAARDAARGEG